VAKLKGARYAVMQEPRKGERLNDGVMKELTGEDPIQARSLFQEPVTFVPQFKLVVSTNNLFDIGSNDDGTWRRIRKVDFESKFVDNPNPTEDSPYEFKVDRSIDKRFKVWKNIFMSMLIERACETMGEVPDCDKVLEASNEYRKGQDYLMEFMKERIKKSTDSDKIKKTEVYEEFKNWFTINYGKNVPKGRELYEFLDKKCGKYKNGWKGYVMVYEDDDIEEEDSD
jgi:P4 family phage/plasmid primase-like protien